MVNGHKLLQIIEACVINYHAVGLMFFHANLNDKTKHQTLIKIMIEQCDFQVIKLVFTISFMNQGTWSLGNFFFYFILWKLLSQTLLIFFNVD